MDFVFILTLIGIIAFAVSGAMVAIRAKADVFGVILMSFITSFGGGILRDVMIGREPPIFFSMYIESIVCLVVSISIFLLAFFFKEKYLHNEELMTQINNVFDAIGLGIFAVTGAQATINFGPDHPFLVIFMAMTTCIGGGMIRDVVLNTVPFVIQKRIYALASIAGAALFYGLDKLGVPAPLPMIVGALCVFSLRMCATIFKWNMPKVVLPEEKKENKG